MFVMEKRILLFLFTLVLFNSCSDSTTVFEQVDEDIFLESNSNILESSISFDNSGVLDVYDDFNAGNQSRFMDEQAGDYPLTLVAQVRPPSFDGAENLTATHVDIVGDFVYVSYNNVGPVYVGGIDIIYIADPANPRLTSRLYFTNADVNSLKYDNGFVYAVGGVDAEASATATNNSFLIKSLCSALKD